MVGPEGLAHSYKSMIYGRRANSGSNNISCLAIDISR